MSDSAAPERDEQDRQLVTPDDEVVDGRVVQHPPGLRLQHRRLDAHWQESRYASPLPSPDDLERYKQLLDDAPERLLAAGEREQAHRHAMESRLARIDEQAMPRFYAGQRRGQFISGIVALGYEAIMLVAVLEGYTLEGTAGAAFGIAAMVWAMRRDTDGGASEATSADRDYE